MRGYTNLSEVISQLGTRVADLVETAGSPGNITMGELADGSGAWYAMLYYVDADGNEYQHRIIAPCPAAAPQWAQTRYSDWRTERGTWS
jgi:hypothetical protein